MNIECKHNTRCHKCKSTIYAMLNAIFDEVEHMFQAAGISVRIDSYKGTPQYDNLRTVWDALVAFRGYDPFVSAKSLHRCDLFLPALGAVGQGDMDEVQA